MSDEQKCSDCGAVHEWTATEQPDGSYVVSAGDTAAGVSVCEICACRIDANRLREENPELRRRIIELKDALEAAAVAATRQFERAEKAEAQVERLRGRYDHMVQLMMVMTG